MWRKKHSLSFDKKFKIISNKTITKLLNLADKAQAAKKQEEMKKAQEEMEALNKIASDNRAMAKKFEDMIKL